MKPSLRRRKARVVGPTLPSTVFPTAPIENLDLAELSAPVDTSVTGFKEIVKLWSSGTKEIRDVLSDEFGPILECRLCRALFRSVANALLHKRHFCTQKWIDRSLDEREREELAGEGEVVREETPSHRRSLSAIVTGLKRRAEANQEDPPESKLSTAALIARGLPSEPPTTIAIRPISTSQPLSGASPSQSLPGASPSPVYSQTVSLPPSKRAIARYGLAPPNTGRINDAMKQTTRGWSCLLCGTSVLHRKSLRKHVIRVHSTSRLSYPCPQSECPLTLQSVARVIQHLTKAHGLSPAEAARLRPAVSGSAQSQQVLKGNPSGPAGDKELCCPKCRRTFLNRGGYHSHRKFCQSTPDVKIEPPSSPPPLSPPYSSPDNTSVPPSVPSVSISTSETSKQNGPSPLPSMPMVTVSVRTITAPDEDSQDSAQPIPALDEREQTPPPRITPPTKSVAVSRRSRSTGATPSGNNGPSPYAPLSRTARLILKKSMEKTPSRDTPSASALSPMSPLSLHLASLKTSQQQPVVKRTSIPAHSWTSPNAASPPKKPWYLTPSVHKSSPSGRRLKSLSSKGSLKALGAAEIAKKIAERSLKQLSLGKSFSNPKLDNGGACLNYSVLEMLHRSAPSLAKTTEIIPVPRRRTRTPAKAEAGPPSVTRTAQQTPAPSAPSPAASAPKVVPTSPSPAPKTTSPCASAPKVVPTSPSPAPKTTSAAASAPSPTPSALKAAPSATKTTPVSMKTTPTPTSPAASAPSPTPSAPKVAPTSPSPAPKTTPSAPKTTPSATKAAPSAPKTTPSTPKTTPVSMKTTPSPTSPASSATKSAASTPPQSTHSPKQPSAAEAVSSAPSPSSSAPSLSPPRDTVARSPPVTRKIIRVARPPEGKPQATAAGAEGAKKIYIIKKVRSPPTAEAESTIQVRRDYVRPPVTRLQQQARGASGGPSAQKKPLPHTTAPPSRGSPKRAQSPKPTSSAQSPGTAQSVVGPVKQAAHSGTHSNSLQPKHEAPKMSSQAAASAVPDPRPSFRSRPGPLCTKLIAKLPSRTVLKTSPRGLVLCRQPVLKLSRLATAPQRVPEKPAEGMSDEDDPEIQFTQQKNK